MISRTIAALFGGYVLGALASVAALALPFSPTEAVLAGTQASFLVHAAAAIWVFAARSPSRAWVGLFAAGLPLALLAWIAVPGAR